MGVTLSQFISEKFSQAGYRGKVLQVESRSAVALKEMSEDRKPWERQPMESLSAFQQFVMYRDMEPTGRSMTKLRDIRGLKRSGADANTRHLAARWKWQERVKAWDADQDRIRREAFEKERIEMAKRQARLGLTMQEKASEGLLYVDPEKLAPREITVLADTGVKIERLARGESTENISQKSVQIVFEGQRPDWLPPDGGL